jgi:hypothetical protein
MFQALMLSVALCGQTYSEEQAEGQIQDTAEMQEYMCNAMADCAASRTYACSEFALAEFLFYPNPPISNQDDIATVENLLDSAATYFAMADVIEQDAQSYVASGGVHENHGYDFYFWFIQHSALMDEAEYQFYLEHIIVEYWCAMDDYDIAATGFEMAEAIFDQAWGWCVMAVAIMEPA